MRRPRGRRYSRFCRSWRGREGKPAGIDKVEPPPLPFQTARADRDLEANLVRVRPGPRRPRTRGGGRRSLRSSSASLCADRCPPPPALGPSVSPSPPVARSRDEPAGRSEDEDDGEHGDGAGGSGTRAPILRCRQLVRGGGVLGRLLGARRAGPAGRADQHSVRARRRGDLAFRADHRDRSHPSLRLKGAGPLPRAPAFGVNRRRTKSQGLGAAARAPLCLGVGDSFRRRPYPGRHGSESAACAAPVTACQLTPSPARRTGRRGRLRSSWGGVS